MLQDAWKRNASTSAGGRDAVQHRRQHRSLRVCHGCVRTTLDDKQTCHVPYGMRPGSACDIDAASRLGTMRGKAECFKSYNACVQVRYSRECWLACAVCSKLSTPGRYLLSVILWLVQNTISVGFPIQLQYCRGSRQVKATGMM